MTVSRRDFAFLVGSGFVAGGLRVSPALADGSTTGGPKKKTTTTTTGGTTTKKKATVCCITNARLNALKAKIRSLARIHNRFAQANKNARKLADDALKEMDKFTGSTSGLSHSQLRGLLVMERAMDRFLARNGDFSNAINLFGNRLNKADILCQQAAATDNCNTRKQKMRQAIRELRLGLQGAAQIGAAADFNLLAFSEGIDLAVQRKISKTMQFGRNTSASGPVLKPILGSTTAELARLDAFEKEMLAGC